VAASDAMSLAIAASLVKSWKKPQEEDHNTPGKIGSVKINVEKTAE
jgi:hypothetical protein